MDLNELQQQSEEFMYLYGKYPAFLDEKFELPLLSEMVDWPGVIGVARFHVLPSFEPEWLYTLVYRQDSLEVSAVVGATSLWASNPQVLMTSVGGRPYQWEVSEADPFDPKAAYRKSATISLTASECPALLASWAAICDASVQAGDCRTETFDGIGYTHRIANQEFHRVAEWGNPDRKEHPQQLALIDAYEKLLRGLKLYPRWTAAGLSWE